MKLITGIITGIILTLLTQHSWKRVAVYALSRGDSDGR